MTEKKVKQIESYSEPKLDVSLFRKKGNSKTFKGYMIQKMKEARKGGNLEVASLIQHFYKKAIEFESSEKIRIKSWRGKGEIKIWETPDKIIVEFPGKRDKNEKPNIQRKEYSKQDINKMIFCINKLKQEFDNKIPSRSLGEEYFGKEWDVGVFSQRSSHTKFTHLLNILDYYHIIHYNRAGFTTIIKEIKDIQKVLKIPKSTHL